MDGGQETIALALPAVVTTDLRLNEPRYATLPNIIKAKKKPIDEKDAADFGIDLTCRLKILKTFEPPARRGGVRLSSAAELVSRLRDEARVI